MKAIWALLAFVLFSCGEQERDYNALLSVADSLALAGNVDSSFNLLVDITEHADDTTVIKAQAMIGQLYINAGMYREAIDEFKDVYNPNKKDSIAGLLGFCFFEINKRDSAIFYLRKSIINGYKPGECYCTIGRYYDDKGNHVDSAKYYYKMAIASAPEYYLSYNNLSVLYSESDLDSALYYVERSLGIKPNEPYALYNKANYLTAQKKYPEAMGYINKAISINLEEGTFYNLKANIFAFNRQKDSSCYYYKKAISLGYTEFKAEYEKTCE